MADDFRQNNKDAKAYYETQQKIAEVIKRQTESWSTFGDAQKEVVKNAKAIKALDEEILKLSQSTSAEERAKAEELKKQREYLVELNKELLKTKTLAQAVGKSMSKWGIDKLSSGLDNILNMYNEMDGSARRTSIQIGMSVSRMNQFRMIVSKSASDLQLLGISAEKVGEMQASFAEETGRQVMLGGQALLNMGALAKRTGMAETEMAGLVGQMEAFGLGAVDSTKMVEGIADMADKMGVNTGKVIKKVQQNLSLLNKLSFKGGIAGMAKMAAYSEKYKLSMEAVAGFADKVFRPEGAIDAAANLQVLGGSLAQMGDPFQLMHQARNDPEQFAKNITKAAASTAVFNKKTGEFEVSAYELDRLREASEATGISMEELVSTAKQSAKISMFESALKVGGDQKEFLSSIAELKDGKAKILVDGNYQDLESLSQSQQEAIAKRLMEEKKTSEERALAAQTTQERLLNMWYALLASLLPHMTEIDNAIRGPLLDFGKKLFETAKYFIENPWVGKLIIGLMLFAKIVPILSAILGPLVWFLNGRRLAAGFNSGLSKGPLGKGSEATSNMVKSKSGKMYDADSPQGRMIRTKGGTQPLDGATKGSQGAGQMGQAAGSQATNMIKGAAAILILSAALFVFAKALQQFEVLQNGWSTLALAAVSLIVLSGALFLVGKIMDKAAGSVIKGSLAIAILGVALIPFAYAMQMLTDVGVGTMLGAALALGAFALAAGIMGAALVPILLGSVAIVALSGAIYVFGMALNAIAPGMETFIAAFGQLPTLIGPMMLMGPSLLLMAGGFLALAGALVAFGASMLIGWVGLVALTSSAEAVQSAFSDVDPSAVASAVTAINNIDMAKVQAIKEMASALSLVSLFGGLKIEFGDLDVKGSIDVKGSGGAKGTDWVNDPIFISKLKDLVWEAMEKGKSGGKP